MKKTILKFFETECDFTTLKSYLINFKKLKDGTYKDVDIDILMDLYRKEKLLSVTLFTIVKEIELQIKRDILKTVLNSTTFDGYSIVLEYNKVNPIDITNIFDRELKNPLKKNQIVIPYQNNHITTLLDNIEFGELIRFYRFIDNLLNNGKNKAYYNFLYDVKDIRNATMHHNLLLTDSRTKQQNNNAMIKKNNKVSSFYMVSKFLKGNMNYQTQTIVRRLSNPIIIKFIVVLIVFFNLTKKDNIKCDVYRKLNKIFVTDYNKKQILYQSSQTYISFLTL